MNCTGDCRSCIDRSQETAHGFHLADGIAVLPHDLAPGAYVEQHAHRYDHTTFVARGSLRVWIEGYFDGEHPAPKGLLVPAGARHHFQAGPEGATVLCIHNVSRTGAIERAG